MRIGVDIMGGDFWPEAPVSGVILARQQLPEGVQIVLVGDREAIHSEFERQGSDPQGFEIIHTDEFVGMDDSPTKALVQKPTSTINVGIGLVKQKKLDGFVSAGNTGAMLVASILGLGKIAGVNRPTIGVIFPSSDGSSSLLCDVGANVDSKPETLYQFGVLASTYMECVMKVDNPRVALVNIGEEANKGPQAVQAAYQLMKESTLINFIGNVEGRDIYQGKADVYVCDGYTGNIVLKFGESLYDEMRSRYPEDDFIETFNFERYGGVPVLGINGISIIGHGISTGKAIANMVHTAVEAVQSNVIERFTAAFQSIQE